MRLIQERKKCKNKKKPQQNAEQLSNKYKKPFEPF